MLACRVDRVDAQFHGAELRSGRFTVTNLGWRTMALGRFAPVGRAISTP
jgi:hypothetical protein